MIHHAHRPKGFDCWQHLAQTLHVTEIYDEGAYFHEIVTHCCLDSCFCFGKMRFAACAERDTVELFAEGEGFGDC